MPIPDFQTLMLPLLEIATDGNEHSMRDAREQLARRFKLSEAEQTALLPSGQLVFPNRVGWARTHLGKAEALDTPRRGFFRITDRGKEILLQKPNEITVKFLKQFPEFISNWAVTEPQGDAQTARTMRNETAPNASSNYVNLIAEDKQTPEEMLEDSYQRLRHQTTAELLHRVKKSSPGFFERLVVDLLIKMGYGGSLKEAGSAIGRSGDEGIDGIIKEDRLGLDLIYLQAKKWEGTVGRPEIQKFVGALHGKRAKKGVFLTTGSFSSEAIEYIGNIDPKVVLIDGRQLAEFMIDFGLGVTEISNYQVKRIDSDYFGEE